MIPHVIGRLLSRAVLFAAVAVAMSPTTGAAQSEEVTIAGCIKAATTEGQFIFAADDKQAYQIQAAEGVEVAAHLNHRVELTGVVEKKDETAVFKASALKMVAASCEP